MEISPVASMLLYILAAVINFIAAVFNWMRRSEKGIFFLGVVLFDLSLWSLFCALELTTVNLTLKMTYSIVQSQLNNALTLLCLLFVIDYYDIRPLSTPRIRWVLWAILAGQVLFELTNPWHHLMWAGFGLSNPPIAEIVIYRGVFFSISNGISVSFLFAAVILLVIQIFRFRGYDRQRVIGLFIATLLPFTTYLMHLYSPVNDVLLVFYPIVLAISGLLISYILFRDVHNQLIERNLELEASLQQLNLEIGERKKTETALRDSEERFNSAFRGSPIGVYIVDLESRRAVDVNSAFLEMTGYAREEVLGFTPLERHLISSTDLFEGCLTGLQEKNQLKNQDIPIVAKNGETIHTLISVERVDLHGKPMGVALITDVSKQKATELMLEKANKELEWALRAKDEFMSAMSHELRTPLTVILGQAQMLQIPEYGPLTSEQIRSVNKIYTSGQRLQEMITDILEYSQMMAGEVLVLKKEYRLDEICLDAIEKISDLADYKQLKVHFSSQPENIVLYTDKRFISHILRHLLGNAYKFTPSGGEIGIELVGNSEAQTVRITVWDTGIGIKEEDFPRLFQSFVQLDSRLSRKYRGIGLGLSFVKAMVGVLDGSTYVESTYGKGSRFSIILPWVKHESGLLLNTEYHETWNP